MSITNYISSKAIIAEVYRKFKPSHSNWVVDGVESIGRGLEIIGRSPIFEHKDVPICISNFKGRLPCGVDQIEAFSYKGVRMIPADRIGGLDRATSMSSEKVYTLNVRYINVNFCEGEIIAHANVVATDKEGYPLVPDAPWHKEALVWKVMSDLTLGGFQHPVIDYKYAFQQWELNFPRAQNEGKLSKDVYEKVSRMWNSYFTDTDAWRNFGDTNRGLSTGFDNEELIEPRDNERTIIHVEVPTSPDIEIGDNL